MAYGGANPIILQLNQGTFSVNKDNTAPTNDIQFDTLGGLACACTVALGSGMISLDSGNGGIPSTSDATRMLGQSTYAPPIFANAASVGVPLSLAPAELGIGTSPSSSSGIAPGAGGLKLRVECSTAHIGTAKLVVLAGTSSSETILADGIGGSVTCSP